MILNGLTKLNSYAYMSICLDRINVAEVLLRNVAEVDALDDRRWTPLHLAARQSKSVHSNLITGVKG